MARLTKAAIRNKVNSIIDQTWPKVKCETDMRGCKCAGHVRTGGKGRPVTNTFEDIANNYIKTLPSTVVSVINENLPMIAGFIDALVAARRELTEEEKNYISTGRDAQVMGLLEGEPTQNDVFIRLSVERQLLEDGTRETLGAAFLRRATRAIEIAQDEANESQKTIYVLVERYAAERNLRDQATAVKHGAPLSAVELMSKNLLTLVITDSNKIYKGLLARVATCTPEAPVLPERDEKGRFISRKDNLATI